MKKYIAVGALFLFIFGGPAPAPSQPAGKGVAKLMAAKLQNSQKVLEGIAVNDFKKITASAEELIELTKTEEWLMHKTPRYEMHSNEFRRSAELLVRKSKDKNIDGATLAFFELTTSCVRCHQYVREIRDARAPDANSGPLAMVNWRSR